MAPASGYADGRDAGGERFVPRWVTYGRNLARGRPYTLSVPSRTPWEAGDPDQTKLTDGVVGPPYPGGVAPRYAASWNQGQTPEITVDLGRVEVCGAFRIQVGAGWPWWDALKGEVKDTVESAQFQETAENFPVASASSIWNLRWKDLPANHFWPDDETLGAHPFELDPARAGCRRAMSGLRSRRPES